MLTKSEERVMALGKMVKHIPNLMTMANLILGMWSISLIIHAGNFHRAALFILLGGLIDFFDGLVARKLNAVSHMGKQLDSFADIITFGVAPIVLINHIHAGQPSSSLIWLTSMVFIGAGAYRLARFNISDFTDHFLGLPIPVAGIALAIYATLHPILSRAISWHGDTPLYSKITSLFLILLSVLMVSRKKIRRFKTNSRNTH